MNLDDFPYKMTLASQITPLVSDEKDKYLALASLNEIKKFIPDLPINSIDLLSWAAQGFNINRANKNDDGINTEIALTMYKDFIYKYLDIEHKRSNLIGAILTANLAEFKTNKILTEDEVRKIDKPFNVILGGVIWKIVNPKLANLIEDSSDPDSDNYMAFGISWELGFKEFNIAILKDESPNLEGAEIITGKEVDNLKQYLKAFGGSGVYKDKRLIRMPTGKIVSLGAAITEKPAACVKGIMTASEKNEFSENLEHLPPTWEKYGEEFDSINPKDHDVALGDNVKSEKDIQNKIKLIISAYKELKNGDIDKNEFTNKTGIELTFAKLLVNYFIKKQNNISHTSKSCVNKNNDIMKLNSIEDITDENLKQISASVISDFIKSEITKNAQTWEAEKKSKDNQIAEAKQTATHTLEKLKTIEQSLADLNKEREDRVKTDSFNARMNKIDASYTLEDDVRGALVDEVKSIASDEDFNKWENRIGVILKAYKKSKSQKDSDEQQALYREDNMNAKKNKDDKKKNNKSEASENGNEIGKDNKSPGQGDNSQEGDQDIKDEDHQFVDRDGKKVNPTDGENNGEHPNQIGKDNWNKAVAKKGGDKSTNNDDDGHNAGASVIEAAIDNAEKEGQHIINTSSSKPLSMKEKYAQMFASSVIVNGKQLNTK